MFNLLRGVYTPQSANDVNWLLGNENSETGIRPFLNLELGLVYSNVTTIISSGNLQFSYSSVSWDAFANIIKLYLDRLALYLIMFNVRNRSIDRVLTLNVSSTFSL